VLGRGWEGGWGFGMGWGGSQVEEQGSARAWEGWSSVGWGPPRREREGGACGPAQEKEKRAEPKGIVKILIYSNKFQTSLNCFDQKVDLPSSKKFK
jgi:hypothetical protein